LGLLNKGLGFRYLGLHTWVTLMYSVYMPQMYIENPFIVYGLGDQSKFMMRKQSVATTFSSFQNYLIDKAITI